MNITTRNFLRLLRAGAFNTSEQVEPMSAWKWRQLWQQSTSFGVDTLVYDGYMKCSQQFFMQLPDDLLTQWSASVTKTEQQSRRQHARLTALYTELEQLSARPIIINGMAMSTLYDQPHHRATDSIDIFLPFDTQGKRADQWANRQGSAVTEPEKHLLRYTIDGITIDHHHRLLRLTNKLNNRNLQGIVEQELRENSSVYVIINGKRVETITPTLSLLVLLLQIAHIMLNEGLALKQLTDLGLLLRKKGDRVDFVKLESWIQKLHMQRMAQLIGTLLTSLLAFTPDEVPFMSADGEQSINRLQQDFTGHRRPTSDRFYFSQGDSIFVHAKGSSSMLWQARRSARFFKYYPTESITNLFASFAHSLTHIEE